MNKRNEYPPQAIEINHNLHFFSPYKSWSDLGNHIHAHIMVILPLAFIVLFPLITLLLPVAWFFLFMRGRTTLADRIMTNLVTKLAIDFLQLCTVPFRCLTTLVLGVAEHGADPKKLDNKN
jgi:hypothetical protein